LGQSRQIDWLLKRYKCLLTAGITRRHAILATAEKGSEFISKGALQAARVLARTGLDILTDAELRQAARADFERRVSGQPYVSPLSPEMKHPLELHSP
jgi:aminobenzoyl-glutamate utilization protein B